MTFFWKFYWLGLVIFVELHVYSEFWRYTANQWREENPVYAHLIPNFITWRVTSAHERPIDAKIMIQPFIAPNLFESHKKLFGFSTGMFHRDENEKNFMRENSKGTAIFKELHRFNLTEFTRAFALI